MLFVYIYLCHIENAIGRASSCRIAPAHSVVYVFVQVERGQRCHTLLACTGPTVRTANQGAVQRLLLQESQQKCLTMSRGGQLCSGSSAKQVRVLRLYHVG
jgi:hypothetical protein